MAARRSFGGRSRPFPEYVDSPNPRVTSQGLIFLGGRVAQEDEAETWRNTYFDRPVKRQVTAIYHKLAEALSRYDLDLTHLVRVDSAVLNRNAIESYREVRARFFEDRRPTSTAVQVDGFLDRAAVIQLSPIAAMPSILGEVEILESDAMPIHSSRPFSKGIRCGSWVFVSGATASAHGLAVRNSEGLADEVVVDNNYWGESAIKLQTDYVLNTKIRGLLRSAALGLNNIVRAHVYLPRCDLDLGAFWDHWKETFNGQPPATVIVPVRGLGLRAARIEISAIAHTNESEITRYQLAQPLLPGGVDATAAGGLLWSSSIGGRAELSVATAGQRPQPVEQLMELFDRASISFENLVSLTVVAKSRAKAAAIIDLVLRDAAKRPAIGCSIVDAPFYAPGDDVAIDIVAEL